MQLIKRLKSLAFAAIALAFAQTALAAEVSTDHTEPRYSLDGDTFYKYENWLTIYDQIKGGTGADNVQTVEVYNVYFDIKTDLIKHFHDTWVNSYRFVKHDCDFGYTTIAFHNCKFIGSDCTYGDWLAFTCAKKPGWTIAMYECSSDAPYFFYNIKSSSWGDNLYNVNFYIEDCNLRTFGGGGIGYGDVTIKNTTLQRNVNVNAGDANVDNAFGTAPAKLVIEKCEFPAADEELPIIMVYANLFSKVSVTGCRQDFRSYTGNGYWDQASPFIYYDMGLGDAEFVSEGAQCAYYLMPPMHIVYDKNGGDGSVPKDEKSYKCGDEYTVMDGPSLKKGDKGLIGWGVKENETEVSKKIGMTYEFPFWGLTLYAIYGDVPREPTGQYRISCLKGNTSRTTDSCGGLTEGPDENGNDILYKDYPWYSDENWMTNVYDTVKTVWGNGSKEDPLTVTIWGKETTPGSGVREPLLLGDGDMTTKAVGGSSDLRECLFLYSDDDIEWTTFVFNKCVWMESSHKATDAGDLDPDGNYKGHYIIDWTKGHVDFVFNNGSIMTNSVTTLGANALGNRYNVGLTFDDVRFEAKCGYTQYFAANVDFRNCTFAAGYYNKIVQASADISSSGGNSSDTSGEARAAYTNNTWEGVSPGQWLVQFGNYDLAEFGYSTIGKDGPKLYVDTKVEKGDWTGSIPDDGQTMTNETFVSYSQKGVTGDRRQVRVVVHPVTVKFIRQDGTETNFYAVVRLSDLWKSTGDNYKDPDASVEDFPDVTTPGNLWYEQSNLNKGYTLDQLKTTFGGPFNEDLTFVEGKPIEPKIVGTLVLADFVVGKANKDEPTGLSWQVGDDGVPHPLELNGDATPPKYEYFIYTDAACTIPALGGDSPCPATLENLNKLTAEYGEGTTYYIRGEVSDFSAESLTHDPISSEVKSFTVQPLTVTLDPNGGTVTTSSVQALPGEEMKTLEENQIPTRTGYKFIGYFDARGEQYYDKDGNPVVAKYPAEKGPEKLIAHWIKDWYEQLGYLQNWDAPDDDRAGYVVLTNFHLNGSNLVGIKYCLDKGNMSEDGQGKWWQNIFMSRTKSSDNKFTEYGYVWSDDGSKLGMKFHYAKDVNDTYPWGCATSDEMACATDTELSVWLGSGANDCLLNGEPYPWDTKGISSFETEVKQDVLLFVADKADTNDGIPEVRTDPTESNRINYCMIGKMYYFKVLESAANPVLKLDLVPVKRTDGVRGFYDTVTENFYPLRMPIQLHYENGTEYSEYVYSVKDETLPAVTPPKYAGHVFLGYFDSNGNQYYDAEGKGIEANPYTKAADLYAKWKLEKPVKLLITAHAHTADVDGKQYVYLAVKPSFKAALTDDEFSTWLNEAKAGNAFKVCASDDGETFSDAIEVILDDDGAHKYDADKAWGWVWMKVDISAAKEADKKYWKAMFVTPAVSAE